MCSLIVKLLEPSNEEGTNERKYDCSIEVDTSTKSNKSDNEDVQPVNKCIEMPIPDAHKCIHCRNQTRMRCENWECHLMAGDVQTPICHLHLRRIHLCDNCIVSLHIGDNRRACEQKRSRNQIMYIQEIVGQKCDFDDNCTARAYNKCQYKDCSPPVSHDSQGDQSRFVTFPTDTRPTSVCSWHSREARVCQGIGYAIVSKLSNILRRYKLDHLTLP